MSEYNENYHGGLCLAVEIASIGTDNRKANAQNEFHPPNLLASRILYTNEIYLTRFHRK